MSHDVAQAPSGSFREPPQLGLMSWAGPSQGPPRPTLSSLRGPGVPLRPQRRGFPAVTEPLPWPPQHPSGHPHCSRPTSLPRGRSGPQRYHLCCLQQLVSFPPVNGVWPPAPRAERRIPAARAAFLEWGEKENTGSPDHSWDQNFHHKSLRL